MIAKIKQFVQEAKGRQQKLQEARQLLVAIGQS